MENRKKNIVLALLFVSGEPVDINDIKTAINTSTSESIILMDNLIKELKGENNGINIIRLENSYQMCANPDFFPEIEDIFKNNKKIKLTESQMEVLAIIAYKQPITKPEINDIRSINSDYLVNKLLEYNLVEEKGRKDTVGKPILIGTTIEFLKFYGISSVSELPILPMDEITKEAKEEAYQLSFE